MTKNAIDQSGVHDAPTTTRRKSGTQPIHREEPLPVSSTLPTSTSSTATTLRPEPWATGIDQDALPTQPDNDAPGRRPISVDLPPPSHDESRDTIPSPPPDE